MTFDYFGHANAHCFMLDYGSEIVGVSKAWIHETELNQVRKDAFSKNAFCQSYGCHTGKSMSVLWKRALGVKLIGAIGKTDYGRIGEGQLPFTEGPWIR